MPTLTLKNLKGISFDETKWSGGFARYAKGVDVYGMGDNASKISYPGVVQCAKTLSAETGALSGTSAITEQIIDFAYHGGGRYACGAGNPIRIYRDDSPWTWLSGVSAENAGTVAASVEDYAGDMYYAQRTYLGQYNNGTGASSSQFKTFTATTDTPRPQKVYSGSLFTGNDQYVTKWDGTTWSPTKLTLPSGFVVKSLEVYSDRLYVSADDGQSARIFIWDGVSTTYEDAIKLVDENVAPSLITDGSFLWIIPNRGTASAGVPIYVWNGGSLDSPFVLPIKRDPQTGVSLYKGGVLIGSEETGATATYEDGIAGIWMIRKDGDTYSPVLLWDLAQSTTSKTVGAIFSSGNQVEVGFVDTTSGSTYRIDTLDSTTTNISGVWSSLPIDAGTSENKIWKGVMVELEQDETIFSNVTVSYRLDYATSFTDLHTFSTTGTQGSLQSNAKKWIPIRRKGKVIEIRVTLTSSSANSARLHSIKLQYSNTNV